MSDSDSKPDTERPPVNKPVDRWQVYAIEYSKPAPIRFKHPEQQVGEIFVCNELCEELQQLTESARANDVYRYHSLRTGKVGYLCVSGKMEESRTGHLVPVFVAIAELREHGIDPAVFAKGRYGGFVEVEYEES